MGTPQVIVVGSYNQDYAWRIDRAPQAGETRRGEDFRSAAGGKGFNQAVACARQGVATVFIAALGDDAAGRTARELATADGIDARWLLRSDAATGSACIVVETGGQNRIIVALGANECLDVRFVQAQADAFATAHVLLAQLENNIEATRAALALARSHRLVRVLNPAPVHAQLDAALLADVDILTPNETEFALLLARLCAVDVDPDQLAAQDDARLHALARRLGVGTLVITLGAHGCFVSHADENRRGDALACYRLAAAPAKVIDTTGAGDAFSGALAAGLVRFAGQPFRVVIEHANRCAALATEGRGAASAMADYASVIARFGETRDH
ncbi:MAG: ribokinase [Dokdonella sp.]|uniref:ribokinase n=1 Tax=Dokdonella sp. TaxID=2291710 RepID=UPI0025BA51CC|nr:ribokinase [Dokdonella sp.]MBZ0224166.1 ribokinase [Dokdonella sp.]